MSGSGGNAGDPSKDLSQSFASDASDQRKLFEGDEIHMEKYADVVGMQPDKNDDEVD